MSALSHDGMKGSHSRVVEQGFASVLHTVLCEPWNVGVAFRPLLVVDQFDVVGKAGGVIRPEEPASLLQPFCQSLPLQQTCQIEAPKSHSSEGTKMAKY